MQVQTIDKMCINAVQMKGTKEIIIWGSNHFSLSLVKKLKEAYGMEAYGLVDDEIELDKLDVKGTGLLARKSEVFFVLITKIINNEILTLMKKYGYTDDDFIYLDLELSDRFTGKTGLEIGGPSQFFYRIYEKINACDGVNFSFHTVWGEAGTPDGYYIQEKRLGDFYLTDAVELNDIKEGYYDFLLSSNNLEHIANPMKAVFRWKRAIKSGGELLIIVPNKEYSFDHNREYTPFSHILRDYQEATDESDLSHLDEIIEKHDLEIDVRAGGRKNFRKRSLDNYHNRCLHHHVFNEAVLIKIFEYCKVHVIECGKFRECYYILGSL